MPSRMREAARRALVRVGDGSGGGSVAVERATFEVTVAGRRELVTVTLDGGELRCASTDGRADGPHVAAVLRLLAGEPLGDGATARGSLSPGSSPGTTSIPPGAVRTLTGMPAPVDADHRALAGALSDVVTSVVRLGAVEADGSPTVDETIERVVRAAPRPLPLGLGRWVGRLRSALATGDRSALALVLEGAAQLADDLRGAPASPEGAGRRVAWLGPSVDDARDVEPLYDRVLVELAREWLPGEGRASLERRYLMDLQSGAVLREERRRGAQGASVGPCPRIVAVGLAEVERTGLPRRVRLLQYAVANEVGGNEWSQVAGWAVRDVRALAAAYRDALGASPGLAEPFALVAPARCDLEGAGVVLLDGAGAALPLARGEDPAGVQVVRDLAAEGGLEWVAGRLVHAGGRLLLVPVSVAVQREGRTTVRRIS